jgi:predicted nucleic acid-binding protein
VTLYLDSSALVKLVVKEAESDPLRRFLNDHHADRLVTSALARTEVVRAVRPGGADVVQRARLQLSRLDQIALTADLLDRAATLHPDTLRTLDAVHLSAAMLVGSDLRAIVTYDHRMADASRALGLNVEAPA